jgi:small subunit ribosomal protein S15
MAEGLAKDVKQELITDYRIHESDTGSPEVQVAVLSKRIADLTKHVQTHKKDFHTRLGLTKLVARRRRLLNYLKREDFDRYKSIIERLGIRR